MTSWRQWFKWTVYALLFVDFAFYFLDDREAARHTLDQGSSLLEVANAYVTSIDLAAWFALILLFELETYVMAGRGWRGPANSVVRGIRLACYVAILHTSFSYDFTLRQFQQPERLPASHDLCAYVDGTWSFLRNRKYTDIDASNCSALGTGPAFYAIGGRAVVTDRAGLREGLVLAWTDLVESIAWLVVVLAIESAVRLQHRGHAEGALMTWLGRLKFGLYALIIAIAIYWGSKGQYLYLWDEIIWVVGFLIIERNLRDSSRRCR